MNIERINVRDTCQYHSHRQFKKDILYCNTLRLPIKYLNITHDLFLYSLYTVLFILQLVGLRVYHTKKPWCQLKGKKTNDPTKIKNIK